MTTSPGQPEPLSVRVARAKGCTPFEHERHWYCPTSCFKHTQQPPRFLLGDRGRGIEDYLQPAASFALLAEMVGGSKDEQWVEFGEDENGFWCQVCDKTCNSYGPLVSESGGKSLEEAVALAYLALLAWKAAQS